MLILRKKNRMVYPDNYEQNEQIPRPINTRKKTTPDVDVPRKKTRMV